MVENISKLAALPGKTENKIQLTARASSEVVTMQSQIINT